MFTIFLGPEDCIGVQSEQCLDPTRVAKTVQVQTVRYSRSSTPLDVRSLEMKRKVASFLHIAYNDDSKLHFPMTKDRHVIITIPRDDSKRPRYGAMSCLMATWTVEQKVARHGGGSQV